LRLKSQAVGDLWRQGGEIDSVEGDIKRNAGAEFSFRASVVSFGSGEFQRIEIAISYMSA
jgi:hypothetical protein